MKTAWEKWYHLRRWEKRSAQQLREQPLCCMCLAKGIVNAASVADHIIPHKGDYQLFWFGKLQSLCPQHHSGAKRQLEQRGYVFDIGADGWPTDSKHPVHQHALKLKQGPGGR
jgi:5-methylcytosine-specific restriction enzyme A